MSSVGQVLFAFFEDYLKVQRGLRPGSIRSYRDTLRLFLTYVATASRGPITRLKLPDLTSDRVLEFLRMIEGTRGNQVATRNQRLAALHTFYRYLAVHHPEMLAGYWPKLKNNEMGIADRLNSMPKHVVSATLKKAEWQSSQIIANNVAENVLELKRRAGQDILIFGSATLVHSLIKANLVDELRFLVHPVIMGNGKRFFRESMPTTKLKPIKTKPMSAGVTALWYTVG